MLFDRQMDRQVDGWDSRAERWKFSKEWETVGGESHDTRRQRDRQKDGDNIHRQIDTDKFVLNQNRYHH